ncbi:OmpA family protein [Marivita hallyeonensis]|uniref:Outer membrane protein OmpA n=1 Tax=Marivita hallyeonensis TaxID=996342 RepID=A0A1M5X4U8_9RHOB|nr:OmpA family protein [Marivita hallyeonensis]SHH94865.1 Outer membrane protein OmpA [Marivita hallyeonensis]
MFGRLSIFLIGAALAVPQVAAANEPERYIPGVWIDPDGCEHWVMDDGVEGFMSPHLRRDGTPVCHKVSKCAIVPTDQMFASGSAAISQHGVNGLRNFFASNPANGFVIEGHTDSRASDRYNLGLSQRRARAVARVAQEAGAQVYSVRGFGERRPLASNATAEGMAKNRRVEILCLERGKR